MDKVTELAERMAALEERMNTHQADYKSALERMERKNTERETRMLLAVAGLLSFAVVILGILIRLPPAAAP